MVFARLSALAFLTIGVIGALPDTALAKPTAKSIRNEVKEAESSIKKILKKFARLSAADKAKVVAALSQAGDADGDGVPDLLELTSKARCDDDSDDDGLDDGDEYGNRTKPNDRDSDNDGRDDGEDDDGNGDGSPDSAELEVKGRLLAKSPSAITVGTTEFVLTASTTYRQGSVRTGLTIDNFELNACIEVEGIRNGTTNTATKVKSEDDCPQ